jgi:hypothetical protein
MNDGEQGVSRPDLDNSFEIRLAGIKEKKTNEPWILRGTVLGMSLVQS